MPPTTSYRGRTNTGRGRNRKWGSVGVHGRDVAGELNADGTDVTVDNPIGWQWGSVAMVFRVPSDALGTPDRAYWDVVDSCDITSLALVRERGAPVHEQIAGAGNLNGISNRWFGSSAIRRHILSVTATKEEACSCKPTRGFKQQSDIEQLDRAGIHIAGISRSRIEPVDENSSFEHIVLHLGLTGLALNRPEWLVSAIHRCTRAGSLSGFGAGSNVDGKVLQRAINRTLGTAGINAILGHGGHMTVAEKSSGPVYTIAVALPHSTIPDRNHGGQESRLTIEQRWAHALSTAQSATGTPTLSDLSEEGQKRSLVSLGPAVGWCSDRGLGIVASAPPGAEEHLWAAEVAHVDTLAHSVFVDLAVLTRCQSTFMDKRAAQLSELAAFSDLETPRPSLRAYKSIQKAYIQFLGQLWIQEIPGRESATRVLRGMQQVRRLEERIKQSAIEQDAILNYLVASDKELAEDAREQEEKQRREERERKDRLAELVNVLAYLFLPATLVFTISGGLGVPLPGWWVFICFVIVAALTLGLFILMRRVRRRAKQT